MFLFSVYQHPESVEALNIFNWFPYFLFVAGWGVSLIILKEAVTFHVWESVDPLEHWNMFTEYFVVHYFCNWSGETCVGIGRPPGKMNPASYVLRPFTKQEREEVCKLSDAIIWKNYIWFDVGLWQFPVYDFQLDFTFQHGTDAVRILLLEGFNKAATFVNTAKPLEQCG